MPMKKFLLLLAAVVVGVVQLYADEPLASTSKPYSEMSFKERFLSLETPNLKTKFEVRIGMPGEYDINAVHLFTDGYSYRSGAGFEYYYGSDLRNEYHVAAYKSGYAHWAFSPELNFMVRTGKRWQMGATMCYVRMRQNRYNAIDWSVVESTESHTVLFNPTLRYDLMRTSWFRLYIQAGAMLISTSQTSRSNRLDFESFWGQGITLGTRFFWYFENNLGYYGNYTASTGFGYRF